MAQDWNVRGTYFEACNCEPACPCIFMSKPTEGVCTALVAWHIENGNFGEVSLDGLNVALYIHSPGNMVEGGWKVALYLDKRADPKQGEGLLKIFSGQAGGHPAALAGFIGEVMGVKTTAIEFQAEGKRRSVFIPELAEAAIEAMPGGGEAEVTVHNHPVAVAPGYPAVVSKSERLLYRDHGYSIELSGRNGLYSPFAYHS